MKRVYDVLIGVIDQAGRIKIGIIAIGLFFLYIDNVRVAAITGVTYLALEWLLSTRCRLEAKRRSYADSDKQIEKKELMEKLAYDIEESKFVIKLPF